jgi:hypothetical protein
MVELQLWGERIERQVRREHRRTELTDRAVAVFRRHTADLRETDWLLLGVAMVTAAATSVLLSRFSPM